VVAFDGGEVASESMVAMVYHRRRTRSKARRGRATEAPGARGLVRCSMLADRTAADGPVNHRSVDEGRVLMPSSTPRIIEELGRLGSHREIDG